MTGSALCSGRKTKQKGRNDMQNQTVLPAGYVRLMELNLQRDRRLMLLVNGLSLLIAAALAAAAHPFIPIGALFDLSSGMAAYVLRFIALLAAMVAYMLLHEFVHGVFMRHFSGVRPHYGFTGLYAYAGSSAYFNKRSYIVIALAPVVLLGVLLAAICLLVPRTWFWVAYAVEIINLSGAAGDYYVTCRLCRLPDDILVQDAGVSMTVYVRTDE